MSLSDSLRIMKALAEASRLKLIKALSEGPQYVELLAERLALSPSTISVHLKKLEEAGLVRKEREQYYSVYHLNKEIFERTLRSFLNFYSEKDQEIEADRMHTYRQRVFRTFFEGNRLIKIPTQFKKRIIVLEALLSDFKPDQVYQESEVNQIIARRYGDYCDIRRYFVDFKWMSRDSIFYHLTEAGLEALRRYRASPLPSH